MNNNIIPTDREIEYFLRHVTKTDGCWIWTGATTSKGYGHFGLRGTTIKAHRFSWLAWRGPIPAGKCVLHDCPGGDNSSCVNPAHLWIGTRTDNNKDMCAKGRHVPGGTYCRHQDEGGYTNGNYKKGTAHHAAKLDEHKVRAIRAEYATGTTSYDKLAIKYGVNADATIVQIIKRKTWKHVI